MLGLWKGPGGILGGEMQLLWCLERLPAKGHEAGTDADGFRSFRPRVCAVCPPSLELLHGRFRPGRDK